MASYEQSSDPGPEARFPELTRFEIVRPLGVGAAGLVFEALDRERHERVALKTLRRVDGAALLQLKDEFRALQDIQHPNLIRLGELMRDGDTWFYTMELVDGVSFVAYVTGESDGRSAHSTLRSTPAARASLRRGSKPPPDETPKYDEARLRAALGQLARGLCAVHEAGKVHRDIKPSNVLVALDGRVVILDFGLVREMSSASEEFVVGTALYMAPEQIAGEDVDPACDWYGVGVVLYLCLTGRHPFEGDQEEVMMRKLEEDPPPPSSLVQGVPPDLDVLCMELLERNPKARPTGTDVLARLDARRASDAPRPPIVRAGQAPFVGRLTEFKTLAAAFTDARADRTVVVVVQGESGVGKSALVRRFTRSLPGVLGSVVILSGRCYERDAVPYKAVDGLIDSLSRYLAELGDDEVTALLPRSTAILTQVFPVLGRVGAISDAQSERIPVDIEALGVQEGRSRLFAALRELFAKLARRVPLVLVIDDMQWADADSLALLAELLRPPLAPSLLLLATARAGDVRRGGTLGLPGDVRVLPLSRLSADEGLELATLLLGRTSTTADPKVARAIANEASGHPLFVDELVRHAQLGSGEAPALVALDDALHARVSKLEPGARRLLEVLAISGIALSQDAAMRAAGLDFAEFSTHVQTLRVGHLVRMGGWREDDVVETYHDRVRESVAGRLDPETRRALHQALASALEKSASPDADALATHWSAAGDAARAFDYTRQAAEQAYRALAFDRAAQLYARALELSPLDDEGRQLVRIRLGEAFGNAGRGVEAAKVYAEAAARAPTERSLELKRRAAEQLLNAGRFDEGDAALREVLSGVGLELPPTPLRALIALLADRFRLWLRGLRYVARAEADIPSQELTRLDACADVAQLLSVVDTIRGAFFQTRTLLLALEAGEPTRLAHALALESGFLTGPGPGKAERADTVLASAELLAEQLGTPQARGAVTGARAFSQFCQGNFRAALELSERAEATLRERSLGAFWDLRMSELISIWALSWLGDLRELSARVDQRAREADARGDLYAATCLRAGPPSIAWLRGDDPVSARAVVQTAMSSWTQRGYHNQHYWGLLAEGQIDLYEGDGEAALRRIERDWPKMKRALMLEVQIIKIEATHLRARASLAAAASQPLLAARERLLRAAAKHAATIERTDAVYPKPLAALTRASIAAMRGDRGEAVPRLELALVEFERVGMMLHANVTRIRLGQMMNDDEGRAHLEHARVWMQAQGIANADGMVRMVAPGFDTLVPTSRRLV